MIMYVCMGFMNRSYDISSLFGLQQPILTEANANGWRSLDLGFVPFCSFSSSPLPAVAEQQNGEGCDELLGMYEDPIYKAHQVDHKFIDLKRFFGNEANLQGPVGPFRMDHAHALSLGHLQA